MYCGIYLPALNMNIESYSLNELYTLFNITSPILTLDVMKQAKAMTLKFHPDKSKLDSCYFLFFSRAYKQLHMLYEFQNKTSKPVVAEGSKTYNPNDVLGGGGGERYDEEEEKEREKERKQGQGQEQEQKKFKMSSKMFNAEFEKYGVNTAEQEIAKEYNEWFASDKGIIHTDKISGSGGINAAFMEIKRKKKEENRLIVRGEIEPFSFSAMGGTPLDDMELVKKSYFTDLKEAYSNTVMDASEEDLAEIPTFKNVNAYIQHRDNAMRNVDVLDKQRAEQILQQQQEAEMKKGSELLLRMSNRTNQAEQNNSMFLASLRAIGWGK
jgi:hypothetical protein